MALVSLGSVTIFAMILWFMVTVINALRPLKHAKAGVAIGWLTCVLWYAGVPV
jgi:hypothetical protein